MQNVFQCHIKCTDGLYVGGQQLHRLTQQLIAKTHTNTCNPLAHHINVNALQRHYTKVRQDGSLRVPEYYVGLTNMDFIINDELGILSKQKIKTTAYQ